MKLFKIRIYDVHYNYSFEEENVLNFTPYSQELKAFNMYVDLDKCSIISFREFVLLDAEDNPTQCTRITLDDGSELFCVHSLETFRKSLEEQKFLPP